MVAPRRITLVAAYLLGTIAVVAGIIFLTRPREPRYQNKTLSQWIVPFCSQTSTGIFVPAGKQYFELLQPSRKAVSEIGTNGVPYLMTKLSRPEPGWHRKLRELAKKQSIAFIRLTDPRTSKIRAIRALAVLGPRAQPAIPLLTAQMADPLLSDHAVYALSAMGPEGFRALIDNFTNAAPVGQMVAALTLCSPGSYYRGENSAYVETNGITPELLIEGFSRVIDNSRFRTLAFSRLQFMGPSASNAVPALLRALRGTGADRQGAVRALASVAPRDVAVATLTNLLQDRDMSVRIAARTELDFKLGYRVRMDMDPFLPPRHTPAPEIFTPGMPGGRAIPSRELRGPSQIIPGQPFTPGMANGSTVPTPGIPPRFAPGFPIAQPAPSSNRVSLKLSEVNLTTNFVVGKIESQGDVPDKISIVVKALKDPQPGELDFSADRPQGTNAAAMGEFSRKWGDQQRARQEDERVDWSRATWIPFTNSVAIDLGTGEGRRMVWLMGKWTNADGSNRSSGTGVRVRIDRTPPLIVLTRPEERTVSKPQISLEGYSPESITDIRYEVVNGPNRVAGGAYVFDRHYDMRVSESTTNQFRSDAIRLTPGTNELYLQCQDAAGNRSTNHYTFVYSPAEVR